MKIKSDILTRANVGDAVQAVPGVSFIDSNALYEQGWYQPIREFKPKTHARGFEIFLTGSSPYNAAHQSRQGGEYEKAATWDEWGIVIDALYAIDPQAKIGHYTSREHFLAQTRDEHQRVTTWHTPGGYQARSHTAPWLVAA